MTMRPFTFAVLLLVLASPAVAQKAAPKKELPAAEKPATAPGEASAARLLILSQVVLSLQLGFAVVPLVVKGVFLARIPPISVACERDRRSAGLEMVFEFRAARTPFADVQNCKASWAGLLA